MAETILLSLGTVECAWGYDCPKFAEKWSSWCKLREGNELAMLPISPYYREDTIDAKTRNMIKKSSRHYVYKQFEYNDWLDDIHEINTSSPIRQGRVMTPAYVERPNPIYRHDVLCQRIHRYVFIGGFDSNGLTAYSAIAVLKDLAIINTILGHVDHFHNAVMNGLIDGIVRYLDISTNVRYLNYLDLDSCSKGLKDFKKNVGFQPIVTRFGY